MFNNWKQFKNYFGMPGVQQKKVFTKNSDSKKEISLFREKKKKLLEYTR